jgi:hypothetical protein
MAGRRMGFECNFFIHVLPSSMPIDYATKLVEKDLKHPVKFQIVPKF